MANSMGLSDRILKMADRRNKGDRMIIYGGMVCCSVCSWKIKVGFKCRVPCLLRSQFKSPHFVCAALLMTTR